MADSARLARLLPAACFAYHRSIYLGVAAHPDGWMGIIHSRDRCELSRFQLGLALLDHLLNTGLPLPIAFRPPLLDAIESVR